MTQETLEEAAERYTPLRIEKKAFIEGAKWQAERMYSEEDMRFCANFWNTKYIEEKYFKEFIEQFKKK